VIRAARAVSAALGILLFLPAPSASAAPERQVLLFLLDGVPYERALAEPALEALAAEGGIGLMTTRVGGGDPPTIVAAAATLGAGAGVGDPGEPVTWRPEGDGAVVDVAPLEDEGGTPGALGEALAAGGLQAGYLGDLTPSSAAPAGMLVAMDAEGRIPVMVGGSSPADALDHLSLLVVELGSGAGEVGGPSQVTGLAVQALTEASSAEEVLVVVAVPSPSAEMAERGDEVTPLIVAAGPPGELAGAEGGSPNGLTSETTGRQGLASNADLAPTVLAFLGLDVPDEMAGSSVRVSGEAPTALHARYLQLRRIRLPMNLLALGVALGFLIAAIVTALRRARLPRWWLRLVSVWGLVAVALPISVLPVGVLPEPTYARALAVMLVLGAVIVGVALGFGRGDPTAPVAIVAGVGLGLLALDCVRGWQMLMTPVIGGGALQGARFYGLGNTYAGVLMAAVLLLASRLPALGGAALIAGAGLFAGLPGLGTDLGSAATLFVAAGLWYALRVRDRLGLREVATAVAAAVLGTAAVVAAHVLIPGVSTHVSGAVESGDLVGTVLRRLAIEIRVTSAVPAAWLIPVALVIGAVIAGRRLGGLDRLSAWRDSCLVLAIGGLVGFLVNDTGIGMAGLAFAFLAVALAYPSFRWMRA
jgi:hypothetical protein